MGKDRESKGSTPPKQFRLGDETLADLDLIAEHHSQETGVKHSRTDAVRVAARKEAERIRAEKPKRKK